MNAGHPFIVKMNCETHVEHLFVDTKEEAEALLQLVFEAVADKSFVIRGSKYVVSLHGFTNARIIEKPADVSDAKWLG